MGLGDKRKTQLIENVFDVEPYKNSGEQYGCQDIANYIAKESTASTTREPGQMGGKVGHQSQPT